MIIYQGNSNKTVFANACKLLGISQDDAWKVHDAVESKTLSNPVVQEIINRAKIRQWHLAR